MQRTEGGEEKDGAEKSPEGSLPGVCSALRSYDVCDDSSVKKKMQGT